MVHFEPAVRDQIWSTGALPVAVTDCLNFGNPEKGDIYWTFEQAVEGIAEPARRSTRRSCRAT